MRACKSCRKRSVAGVLAVFVLAFGASGYGQEIQWIPVSSTGPAVISGNEITISGGGVRVQFDIFLSGWGQAPGVPDFGAFAATAVGADMLGANASPPNPGVDLSHQAKVACASAADCATGDCGSFEVGFCDDNQPGFQFANRCLDDPNEPCALGATCAGLPICIPNTAFIGSGDCIAARAVVLPPTDNYEFIVACQGAPVVDIGQVAYGGSINFDVPPNAEGTYTITFHPDNERTLVNDQNGVLIPGLVRTSGLLTIVEDTSCCINGNCLTQKRDECLAGGGTVVPACLGDGGNDVDDACETDCDGDGTIDVDETDPAKQDCDFDGICNGVEIASCTGGDPLCADCNANGIPDECDIASGTSTDCNNNNSPDECEIAVGSIGPGGPFFCTANCEPDCNQNGLPDACDIAQGTSTDCNNNNSPDECDIEVGSIAPGGPFFCTANCDPDCNNSGIPDSCDLVNRTSADCTGDGIPDECNIADGTSDACNNNGIPDECDGWACCLDTDSDGLFESCAMATEALCLQADGFFRGPCHVCPEQSVAIIPEPGGGVFIHVIGPPVNCLTAGTPNRGAARGDCGPGVPKIDPWTSNSDAQMCHNFGAPGHTIPADFFAPGSDPFGNPVCLVGTPLGVTAFGDFGEADTLISRTDDPFDRCSTPSAGPSTVDLEVVALSLVDDSDPLTVTFNGGQNPELWTVAVDLSAITPPVGSLTATKTHCNGGTYTSVLNVQPRFTFTKVGDPGQVRVLDTGLEGISHVSLIQDQAALWVHDVDPNLGLTFDPCSSFHPGVEDTLQTVDCDCDGNQVRDKCDIEADPSLDCNLNTVPDSCDVNASTSPDCNGNNVPDECELSAPAVPAAPPDNIHKNRFVSLVPNNPACVAIRVELLDLRCSSTGKKCSSDADCKICDAGGKVNEACSRSNECPDGICVISGETCNEQSLPIQLGWVDDPFVPDSDRIPPETFGARVVQIMPTPRSWTEAVVHVGDCEIAPVQTYGFSATIDGVLFSPRLVLGTTPKPQAKFWGDCVGKFTGTEWTPPNNFVDVNDVQAMIKFLVISQSAPHMARVDLGGEAPNWLINASDLQLVIKAFIANTYPPFAFPNKGGPADCP